MHHSFSWSKVNLEVILNQSVLREHSSQSARSGAKMPSSTKLFERINQKRKEWIDDTLGVLLEFYLILLED